MNDRKPDLKKKSLHTIFETFFQGAFFLCMVSSRAGYDGAHTVFKIMMLYVWCR